MPKRAIGTEEIYPANGVRADEAEAQLQRILSSALFCNSPRHSRFLSFTVLAELRQAQLLDPLSPMITEGVAENYYYWRRYDDAIVQLDKLQAIGFTASQELRGLAYIQTGRYQQALKLFEDMRQHVSRPTPLLYLAMAHAAAGHREEATRLLNAALEQKNYISAYSVALVYASLGDKNSTIEWLQKAVEQKDPLMGNAKVDPMLDSIRSEPRYFELLKQADLAE